MIQLQKSGVVFRSEDHTYWLGEKQLKGITGTLIKRAFPDKYKDVNPAVLANAARRGTELHEAIAFQDRFGGETDNGRVLNYLRLKEERGLETVENEYLVTDYEQYASSIDIVMTNCRGEVCLVDTKTTYVLDKKSVALQLSIYRRFFEKQNPGLKVAHIYALWLPNKDESICQLIELSPYDDETLDALFAAEEKDEPFVLEEAPAEYGDIESELRKWTAIKEEADAQLEALRGQLLTLMESRGLSQIKSGYYTVSYIGAKKSSKFDSTRFKKEHGDLYKQYQKETETKATLRLTAHN